MRQLEFPQDLPVRVHGLLITAYRVTFHRFEHEIILGRKRSRPRSERTGTVSIIGHSDRRNQLQRKDFTS